MKLLNIVIITALSLSVGIGIYHFSPKKGNALAAKNVEENSEEKNEVELSKKSQQLVGLATQEVKLEHFVKKISVVGEIAQDPESSAYATTPVSGVLAECNAKIGTMVTKGEKICTVKNGDSLVEVKSPASGIIISVLFKVGDKIDTVSSMHTIADFSKLWATFDVYEKDIANIKLGQKVIVRSIAYPDKSFTGEITFIAPGIDEATRAMKVRVLIQNPDYLLKLGMFVSGDIVEPTDRMVLLVPQAAIVSINDKNAVFMPIGEEKFAVRPIEVGQTDDGLVEVKEGLKESDIVVTNGSFQLKSELLKSSLEED